MKEIVKELKNILKLDSVFEGEESPRIEFHANKIRDIPYLENNFRGYFINHPEFSDMTLQFSAIEEYKEKITHYYMQGEIIHRDLLPAKISHPINFAIDKGDVAFFSKTWYKNGLVHREDGPACMEFILPMVYSYNPETGDDLIEGEQFISFHLLELEWFLEGNKDNIGKMPIYASLRNGYYQYFVNDEIGEYHHSKNNMPSLKSEFALYDLEGYPQYEKRTDSSPFDVVKIELLDYERYYDNGNFLNHKASKLDIRCDFSSVESSLNCGDSVKNKILEVSFPEWNLWKAGKLFKSNEDKVVFTSLFYENEL